MISPEWFVREAKDSGKLQYKVHCENSELLEASYTLFASATDVACGSDTKSIACQVSNDVCCVYFI